MAVGQLVVKLGLDAAEYTQGLSKAELQARRFGETIGEGIRSSAVTSAGALIALGGAALTANAAFNKLLDGAAKFQDLSEETGASAVSIAGLSVAAATAGVSIESVAGSMNKLTKNLVGVDDESKAAGAALGALGLNVQSFKALDPARQYDAVSKALAGFADGAGKTAVAMALFGKSGAEQLKVLKALQEQGGATNILTAEQIARADEYRDAQAKLTAEIGLYASAIATEFVGPTNELKRLALEAAKELFGLSGEVSSLGRNNGVRDFAEGAAVALVSFTERLGTVIQGMATVGRAAQLMGTNLRIASEVTDLVNPLAMAKKAVTGEKPLAGLEKAYKENQDAVEKLSSSWQKTVEKAQGAESKKLKDLFAQRRQDEALNAYYGISNQKPPDKPPVKFGGAPSKGKTDNSAAQEAKAQLSSDLDAIKNAQEAIANTYANQEKILEALRSAGLKDETQYYQEKQRLLALNATAQEDGLQKTIARLQAENLSGKDAIDNAKKIADAEAKLAKVREDSATQAKLLGIQQEAAYNRIETAILSARQAAQDFFDTTNRGYARELSGIGKGSKSRNADTGITQIEDKYRQQRQDLQNQRRQDELKGVSYAPGTDAAKQFDGILADINAFQQKSIDSYKTYYDTLNEAQSNWLNGATEALHNYSDEASNVAKHTEEAFTNAFKGLEDQFTNLLSGKKFDGKKLLDDLKGDLTRNFVKENITGPLAALGGDLLGDGGLLSGIFGGAGKKNDPLGGKGSSAGNPLYVRSADPLAGAGGLLSGGSSGGSGGGLFGSLLSAGISAFSGAGGLSTGAAISAANLTGGGLDDLFKFTKNFAGRAGGGFVNAGGMYPVNENGPELLDVNGKQMLMMGSRGGRVTSNGRMGGGRSLTINYQAQPGESRKTASQNGRALAAQLSGWQGRDS